MDSNDSQFSLFKRREKEDDVPLYPSFDSHPPDEPMRALSRPTVTITEY